MALISLIYVSVATNRKMSGDELKEILLKARENNQKRDITGMLLFRNGFFMQALEGEEDEVMEIFDTVSEDTRHRKLLIIHKNKIGKRNFSDWSMGFNVIDDETLKSLEGFNDFLEKPMTTEYFGKYPNHAITLLSSFAG